MRGRGKGKRWGMKGNWEEIVKEMRNGEEIVRGKGNGKRGMGKK